MSISQCSLPNSNRQVVRLPSGKVIGWIEQDIFTKPVYGSKHRLRQPPAWAVDADAFDLQVQPFANWIVIWDKETDIKYRVSVERFHQQKGTLDRGFGVQYFLLLSQWAVIEPNGNKPRQLGLWGDEIIG